MTTTLRDATNATLSYIGEVAGPGVQMFSEDRVFDGVIRGFDLLFKKRKWNQYQKWYRLALDGTLGIITTDALGKVRDFEDFIAVYRDTENQPLPPRPTGLNPYRTDLGSGTRLRYWDSLHVSDANYANRKLQFYPVTATGYVNINAMEYPLDVIAETWDWDDFMYFDKDLLMYAAAVEVLSGDDLNTSAAGIAQGKMESKYKDIINGLADHPIPIRQGHDVPNLWVERA